jgi:hypothetical protein
MDWLASNWAWILLIIAFSALHVFGHGHRGHRHGRRAVKHADEAPGARRRDPDD